MNDNSGHGRSPRWPRPQGARAAAVMTAIAGFALMTAACGASGSSTGGGSTYYQKAVAYAQCMRSHGVPSFHDPNSHGQFPPTQEGRNGVTPQAVQSAQHDCQHLQPGGGPGTAQQQQGRQAQALNYARCMRAHGVPNFPDPSTGNGGMGFNLSGVDTGSPQYHSANRVCQSQSARG